MLNQLILGDNLEVLKSLPSESVDLCYIDPPFFSNRNYAVIWGDKGEMRSFEDCWDGGIDTYINWMYKRVTEIHRILKPTGSFYLHCDWHADAYLRVFVLDKIFGIEKFRNEITWQRTNAHNDAKKKMPNLSDKIFYYSKSKTCTYNPTYTELNDKYIKDFYKYQDENGVYRLDNLTGPKVNSKDKEWKGYHPANVGRSWSVSKEKVIELAGKDNAKELSTLEKLDLLFENGLIAISKNGVPSFKRYLENTKGNLMGDIWADISNVGSQARERIGYPTQKPEALLERIIKASSNEGDTVLDCFMGGGTTIATAQKLGRNWIGIDQSPSAFGVTRERILAISKPLFPIEFEAKTAKWDWDNLRKMDDFEFEKLCVKTLGGEPTKQAKGGDLGIDGILNNWSVISVKRSENIGRNVADNLRSAILRFRREKNIAKQKDNLEFTLQHGEKINLANYDGFIIAFSFGKGLKAELAQLEREEGFKILPLTVEDILPVAKRPKVILKVEVVKNELLNPCLADIPLQGEQESSNLQITPSKGSLEERGFKTGACDYKFIATANTDDNRLIEFFAFKILVKKPETPSVKGAGGFENHAFDNFNKTGIFETELKKGEYKVTATATDEYGLTGNDETELTIKG